MNLIASLDETFKMIPGELIQTYSCCTGELSKKCKRFYELLFTNGPTNQFVRCPCGLSAIKRTYNDRSIVYTCFREKRTYAHAAFTKASEKIFNPVLESEQVRLFIKINEELNLSKTNFEMQKRNFDNILHEVKKLNGIIKEQCNTIFEKYSLDREDIELTQNDISDLFCIIRTIYSSSNMIYSKYALYDFENEPGSIRNGTRCAMGVFKKFDKMRRILKNYRHSGIRILISGSSYKSIMMYGSFDSIPLLLLDNAIKYSPAGRDININFVEEEGCINVTINSLGPYVEPDDINRIFERGFRAKSAQHIDGSDIGLYFVKKICDLHNIQISVQSDKKRRETINGISYAPFIVSLKINDAFDGYAL